MIYTELTNLAMITAYNAHHGQYDINGVPYIFHPYHVAEQMTTEYSVCAALLHDVAEDTDVTIEDLKKIFPAEVTDALELLTHRNGTDYFEYVRKIKTNPIAREVKLADIKHNSDQSRITKDTPETRKKKENWKLKYEKALKILTED